MDEPMIKAVYFDLDNTLVNRNASIEKFAHAFAEVYGARYSGTDSNELSDLIRKVDNGGYLPNDSKYKKIYEAIGYELHSQLNWISAPTPHELTFFGNLSFLEIVLKCWEQINSSKIYILMAILSGLSQMEPISHESQQ